MRPNHLSWRAVVVFACLALLLSAPSLLAQERWFHVRVSEGGTDPVEVSVNFPLSLIEKAIGLIPDEVDEEIHMELNDVGIEIEELREFWREVRESGDATYVTVESEDETVRVAKEGDYLIARTVERREGGAEVDVKFPFEVLDALFSGAEDEIDLVAAIRALAEHGDGDMVTVREGDTNVRVWVDDVNEPAV